MSTYTLMMRTLGLTVCTGSAILFAGCMGSAEPPAADPADPAAAATPAASEPVGQTEEAFGNNPLCPPTALSSLSPSGGPNFAGPCNPFLPPALQAFFDGALVNMIAGCASYCGQSTPACISPLNATIVSATTFCFNQDGAHRYLSTCVCDP